MKREKGKKFLEIIEVHNVWTIYASDSDNPPIAQMSRPQDWGNKERWHYERFYFEWILETTRYINHAHCWTDIKVERGEHPMLFASLIVQIAMPGANFKLCGMDYLDEDDFWSEQWGEMPPYFDPYEENND